MEAAMSCTDVSSADRVDGEILEVGMAGAMSQHRSVKSRVDHKLHLRGTQREMQPETGGTVVCLIEHEDPERRQSADCASPLTPPSLLRQSFQKILAGGDHANRQQ